MIKQVAVCDMCSAEAEMVYHAIQGRDVVPQGWFDVSQGYNQPKGGYVVTKYILCSLKCVVDKYQNWLLREQRR